MEDRVGLVGWPIEDSLPTCQLSSVNARSLSEENAGRGYFWGYFWSQHIGLLYTVKFLRPILAFLEPPTPIIIIIIIIIIISEVLFIVSLSC